MTTVIGEDKSMYFSMTFYNIFSQNEILWLILNQYWRNFVLHLYIFAKFLIIAGIILQIGYFAMGIFFKYIDVYILTTTC